MFYLLLFFLAGIAKALMDISVFSWHGSILSKVKNDWFIKWSNAIGSWKLKYKDEDPRKGPAFFGSTTYFVFVTDFWHFTQFLFLTAVFAGVVLYSPMVQIEIIDLHQNLVTILNLIINFSIVRIVFGAGFAIIWKFGRKF